MDEIEILWPDHQGHARGKRLDAAGFLERAAGTGFAFCDAALTWDVAGDIKPGLRLSGWETGYPDLYAVPDLATFAPLPWRPRTGQVVCDVFDHHGAPIRTAPRTVLRRVTDRLAALGYAAQVGVEIEFHLLDADGRPLFDGAHAYSLQKLNELDPVIGEILSGLRGFVALEGGNSEYGSGQAEVNLRHAEPIAAADQAARLKYATREIARRAGVTATFMAKPFADESGNSMHLHVSLWRDGEPAFAPEGDVENALHRRADRRPAGASSRHHALQRRRRSTRTSASRRCRSHRRRRRGAATTARWRCVRWSPVLPPPGSSCAPARPMRSRTGPWRRTLAAIVAALESDEPPALPTRGEGNRYGSGDPIPATLERRAWPPLARTPRSPRSSGVDAVHDYTALAELEWGTFVSAVSDWDRDRYLRAV